MTVRDIDRGAARLTAALERLASAPPRVTVGVHEEDGSAQHPGSSSATIREVALLSEFGSEHQPPRSFVRATVDDETAATERELAAAAERVARGENVEDAFGRVAVGLRDKMRARMSRTVSLDEETVRAKGSPTPLEDTGALHDAVRAYVNGTAVG